MNLKEKFRSYLRDMDPDTWDLVRWRKEQDAFNKLVYILPIVFLSSSIFFFFYHSFYEMSMFLCACLFLSVSYAIIGLWYYPRKIRQLEEAT